MPGRYSRKDRSLPAIHRLLPTRGIRFFPSRNLASRRDEIGGIKIVFASNSDQGEQSIAAGIAQCRAHPVRLGRIGNGANRPVGGNPLPGGMGQNGGQIGLRFAAAVVTVRISGMALDFIAAQPQNPCGLGVVPCLIQIVRARRFLGRSQADKTVIGNG
jgi:hypothetical protein